MSYTNFEHFGSKSIILCQLCLLVWSTIYLSIYSNPFSLPPSLSASLCSFFPPTTFLSPPPTVSICTLYLYALFNHLPSSTYISPCLSPSLFLSLYSSLFHRLSFFLSTLFRYYSSTLSLHPYLYLLSLHLLTLSFSFFIQLSFPFSSVLFLLFSLSL